MALLVELFSRMTLYMGSTLLPPANLIEVWIWQEIRLANSEAIIMCGSCIITWPTFRNAILCLFNKTYPAGTVSSSYYRRRKGILELCDNRSQCSFQHLAGMARHSQCSDLKDKVFALRSIVSPAEQEIIVPDYTKSLQETYLDVLVRDIEIFRSLRLLTKCQLPQPSGNMPSYIPDWSRPKITDGLIFIKASGDFHAEVFFDKEVMHVTGVVCGTVKSTDVVCEDVKQSYISTMDEIARLLSFLPKTISMSRFCRVLCANLFSGLLHPALEIYPNLEQSVADLDEALNIYGLRPQALINRLSRYFYWCQTYLSGKSLFLTKENQLGIGPNDMQENDIVVVLLGCEALMILRPAGSGQYQVVGEAYLEGFADTEALLGPLPKNIDGVWHAEPTSSGLRYWRCIDRRTNKILDEDPRIGPRLGSLPAGWRKEKHSVNGQPYFVDGEGNSTWFDPRIKPDALRERGVKLQVFELI